MTISKKMSAAPMLILVLPKFLNQIRLPNLPYTSNEQCLVGLMLFPESNTLICLAFQHVSPLRFTLV